MQVYGGSRLMVRKKEVKKIISEMVEKIATSYQPLRIILFGSYAYGNPDEDSDIDLLIIKKTNERPIDRWMSVCTLVSDRTRRIPFEPIVVTPEELENRIKGGDQFIEEIITKGELLYDAG